MFIKKYIDLKGATILMEKKLPIIQHNKVTTYLNFSLPLCALGKNNYEWFMEHFSNIYSMRSSDEYLWLDYHEDLYFPNDVFDYSFMNTNEAAKISSFEDYIISSIDSGNYIIIFVDSYFVNGNENYQKVHIPLQLFIYGYSLFDRVLYSIGFDENHRFKDISYKLDEVNYAACFLLNNLENTEYWVKSYFIISIKEKNDREDYRFDADKAIEKISDYVYSIPGKQSLRPEIIFERGDVALYGIKAQEEVLNSLKLMETGRITMDYRFIHLIAEHKKLMNEKIFAIAERKGLLETMSGELEEYSVIARWGEKIRLKYIKNVLAENNMKSIFGTISNLKVICDISRDFANFHEREERTLQNVLKYFM